MLDVDTTVIVVQLNNVKEELESVFLSVIVKVVHKEQFARLIIIKKLAHV